MQQSAESEGEDSVDTVFEGIMELFVEGFLDLYKVFVPNKQLSNGARRVLKILLFSVGLVLLAAALFGIVLVIEAAGKTLFGWVLIVPALLYLVIAVTLKIINHFK